MRSTVRSAMAVFFAVLLSIQPGSAGAEAREDGQLSQKNLFDIISVQFINRH